jgi:hypothetical protein
MVVVDAQDEAFEGRDPRHFIIGFSHRLIRAGDYNGVDVLELRLRWEFEIVGVVEAPSLDVRALTWGAA